MKSKGNRFTDSDTVNSPNKTEVHVCAAAYFGMSFDLIDADTVISVDAGGRVLCRFGDDTWLLTQMRILITDRVSFDFATFKNPASTNSVNIVFCKMIFLVRAFGVNRHFKQLRVTSLVAIFNTLRSLCREADFCGKTIEVFLQSPSLLEKYQSGLSLTESTCILTLLRFCAASQNCFLHFHVDAGFEKAIIDSVNGRLKQQTAVIPSRILHEKFGQYMGVVKGFLKRREAISGLMVEVLKNPIYGRAASSIYRVPVELREELRSKIVPEFMAALELHGLPSVLDGVDMKSVSNIATYLALVQYCAKCLIHIFTLMRYTEAMNLVPGCVRVAKGWNKKGVYVLGVATKLKGVITDTAWISVEQIRVPLEALTEIRQLVLPSLPPIFDDTNYLFLSPAHLPFASCNSESLVTQFGGEGYESYLPPVLIQEEDLRQLQLIDPLGDWESDERFRVGMPWKIASHQFRRTMMVFVAQSGLVDLPEAMRLLNHITSVMTLYYQKGCSAGRYNMRKLAPVITAELDQVTEEAEVIMYLRDVLISDDVLGAHGEKVTKDQKDRSPEYVFSHDFDETLKKIQRGVLAWAPTPVGGCTSTEPCNKRAHANFTECDSCTESVLKLEKIKNVIDITRYDVNQLDTESFEYRAESRNLADYEDLLKRTVNKYKIREHGDGK